MRRSFRRIPTMFALTLAAIAPVVPAASAVTVTIDAGSLAATVGLDPFGIEFVHDGNGVLATSSRDPLDLTGRTGPLGFAVGAAIEAHQVGYHVESREAVRWFHATSAVATGDGTFDVVTDDPAGRRIALRVSARAEGVIEIEAVPSDARGVVLSGAAFASGGDERFIGFGERSDGADQTGRRVVSWNEEGPWAAGSLSPATDPIFGPEWQGPEPLPGTNFSIPSFLSSRGYGFLLDSTWLNEFRPRSDRDDAWSVATREPVLRYRVYGGPTPAGALARFSADVGRQPAPAEWFFGPWYQQKSGYPPPAYWRDRDVPITVQQTSLHYLPCGDHLKTPDAVRRQKTTEAHASGFMITAYVNSFVCLGHPGGAYDEGDANGYFIKTVTGHTYPVHNLGDDPPWHGVPDFTNPEAAEWWRTLATPPIEDGYDGWMEDYGEYVPVDAVASDGRVGLAFHNDYCTMFHEASDELIRRSGDGRFAQFVRCGYTGTAKFARLVWGGDPTEDWSPADGLAAAVSQGQSMGASGIGYWGSDIGGFHPVVTAERTDAELLNRWLQFGAFSGFMSTRATNNFSRPDETYPNTRAQVWDADVQPIWRKFAKLRTQLFPYVWAAAQEYQESGMPLIRHLGLSFPQDPAVYDARYEYMFGPDLLVAPVVEPGARTRTLYLPPGDWVNFWEAVSYDDASGAFEPRANAAILEGGRVVTVNAPLYEIPLFARAGTCLALLPPDTDTLAEVGTGEGLVHLSDTTGRRRVLGFAAQCGMP